MARLSIILDVWDPRRGGLEAYAARLATAMQERGHSVRAVCAHAQESPDLELLQLGGKGLEFYRNADALAGTDESDIQLSMRHPGRFCRVFAPLGGLFVAALAARRRFEPPWLRLPRALARRLSRRTQGFLQREAEFMTKATGHDLILAPSESVRAQVGRWFPDCRARVEVTGLPVDSARFGELPSPRPVDLPTTATALLLWIGNDPVRKGLGVARAVLRGLRRDHPDLHLALLGHDTARHHGKEPGLIGAGHCDPLPWYQAADILLAPSLEDSFNLAVAEALACGVPVVTTRQAGASMLLSDPILGQVVADPRDVAALAMACRTYLGDPEQTCARSRALRRAAVEPLFLAPHFDRVHRAIAATAKKSVRSP